VNFVFRCDKLVSGKETIMSVFTDRLNYAMSQKDMTAAELSRKTGISEAALSNYRKGKYEPKRKQLYLISLALNVSPSWLMGLDLEENEDKLDQALASLWSALDERQKNQVLDYIRFLTLDQKSST
jgi:transcriptional regulator with XRE-family HTH domain